MHDLNSLLLTLGIVAPPSILAGAILRRKVHGRRARRQSEEHEQYRLQLAREGDRRRSAA